MSTAVADIRVQDLGELEEVADGGQGVVYRLPGRAGQLLKRYHPGIPVDGNELRRLIARPASMTPTDRRLLEETAAWPMVRVTDGGRCVGFLMREAPSRFSTRIGTRHRLIELQYLLYPQKPMWRDLVLPSDDQRRELARLYVRFFQLLHRYDIVVGDVSMKNLLWSLQGGSSIFALDCDGYRVTGHHPVVPQAQTPDWEDPTVSGGRATHKSDQYKLALLVVRVLLADPRLTPQQVAQRPGLTDRLGGSLARLVARAADDTMARPHPDQWLRALDGRPTVPLPRLDRSGQQPGKPPARGERSKPRRRPTIRLEPPPDPANSQ